ncbi:protein of unknown function [Amycolatopsis xylanica]|uniref:Protein-glutamine gamma-glutamyltransferase-like C-terminal domain-containing protein n=1 Tax=Amycolatopsis xylanica TaxID=589385 RepID=A0A1H3SK69_9PSEU|nr:DUF4129 domain-containing protein [Amycolatopsis xylanica]SDZ38372.1 protein of unknown function [Amycolatopsis xylanica]
MDIPVVIGRDDARRAAQEELTDQRYQAAKPSWFDEALRWLAERLGEFLGNVESIVPGGVFGLVAIVVILIGAVVAVRVRSGKIRRAASADRLVFDGGRSRSAAEHRKAAEEAAGRGDFADAVRERFRAIVRALEERALLEERSGRTADEAAADAGRLLPELAAGLYQGARLFDDVHYGDRTATEAGYRELTDLDQRIQKAKPVAMAAG